MLHLLEAHFSGLHGHHRPHRGVLCLDPPKALSKGGDLVVYLGYRRLLQQRLHYICPRLLYMAGSPFLFFLSIAGVAAFYRCVCMLLP